MAATFGWYGPLIDLSRASSHVGDYVQLLVLVHKSTPVQYKLSKNGGSGGGGGGGEELIRMDIQVGDDTRKYFPVSIWQKKLGSKIVAGDIILLQNVKVARFRDVTEARTLPCSSVQSLVHSNELLVSKGVHELIKKCRIGETAKNKLHKVIEWMQRAGFAHGNDEFNCQGHKQPFINWKVHEEVPDENFLCLIQLKHLPDASKATCHASIGEIFLPITWRHLPEIEAEKMFVSRRIYVLGDNDFVDDLMCTGCQLCGIPLSSQFGSNIEQNNFPIYCPKGRNGLHIVGMIYRPFMLYVWDDTQCIPLLVENKAAELLFGNITAEKVYCSYERQKNRQNLNGNGVSKESHSYERIATTPSVAKHRVADFPCTSIDAKAGLKVLQVDKRANHHLIWVVLLKMLLKQGKNSPLKFNIKVNACRDSETGRYEMLSVSMPSSSGQKASCLQLS